MPHIQADVRNILDWGWDMMIAHPPCTYLASSGARWFKDRQTEQVKALWFVQSLMEAPIDRIAIENPVGVISTRIRKPDQIVHPWQFGHGETKATCWWLKNLPKLKATNVVNGPQGITVNRALEEQKPFPARYGQSDGRTMGIDLQTVRKLKTDWFMKKWPAYMDPIRCEIRFWHYFLQPYTVDELRRCCQSYNENLPETPPTALAFAARLKSLTGKAARWPDERQHRKDTIESRASDAKTDRNSHAGAYGSSAGTFTSHCVPDA